MLPADAGAVNGDTIRYVIVDGTDFEEGVGTIANSGATVQRTTVTRSKIGGVVGTSKLNLSGAAVVAFTLAAADVLDPADNLSTVADADTSLNNLHGVSTNAQSLTGAQRSQARSNIAAPWRGHLFGLTLSTAGGSVTFSVAPGEAADSTGADLMALSAALAKSFSANWSVGNNGGALDTGSTAANTWYHVILLNAPIQAWLTRSSRCQRLLPRYQLTIPCLVASVR